MLDFKLSLIDADFDDEQGNHPAIISLRAQQPVNEFDYTDRVITKRFSTCLLTWPSLQTTYRKLDSSTTASFTWTIYIGAS